MVSPCLPKFPRNLVVLLRAGHGLPLHASAGILRRFSRRLRFTGTLDERDASQDWGRRLVSSAGSGVLPQFHSVTRRCEISGHALVSMSRRMIRVSLKVTGKNPVHAFRCASQVWKTQMRQDPTLPLSARLRKRPAWLWIPLPRGRNGGLRSYSALIFHPGLLHP